MHSRQQVLQQVQHTLETYDAQMRRSNVHHNDAIREAGDTFLDILRTTDAVQAQLVVAGYLLCSTAAADSAVLEAAKAIQMIHSSLGTIKGTPTAAIGLHAAEIILANLDAPAELRLKAVSITNRSLLLHAQAEAGGGAASADLAATEAILNPLHVGMVLAGADCDATDAITPYALAVGRYYVTHDTHHLQTAKTARQQLTFWPESDLQLIDDIFGTLDLPGNLS